MTKIGWWHVSFDITIDGEETDFDKLSETSQEHILKMIRDGFRAGEVVEESDDEGEDNCQNSSYNCDACVRNGDCPDQGIDGEPRWKEEVEMPNTSRWPQAIHSRGYDAYLCGVQPLADGMEAAIYRFPGGPSLVDDTELEKQADEFHRLMSIVWATPSALNSQKELFEMQPVDWYKEIALHSMKSISHTLGPEQFTHRRDDVLGWQAHHVTKAVFEEQDLFDPYADVEFLKEAESLLPWYIKRYTGERA